MILGGLSEGFSGRIGQQGFWLHAAALMLAGQAFNQIPLFGPLLVMALLWPWTCLTARRLHDGGRSAAPAALVSALCAVSGVAGILLGVAAAMLGYASIAFHFAMPWSAAAGLVATSSVALVCWAGLLPGDAGENRFGPPEAFPIDLGHLIKGRR